MPEACISTSENDKELFRKCSGKYPEIKDFFHQVL